MEIPGYIEPAEFHATVRKLRLFFESKGWIEVHTQNRLSILAACEDPTTIATYTYAGQVWPLPQTGQMWLEHELLRQPDVPGFFCLSTSYRNEPDPVPGRHDKIFPMFEFECRGGLDELIALESELCQYLGFEGSEATGQYPRGEYNAVAAKYGVAELEHEHEAQLCKDSGPVYFLTGFPNHTSPFWNMAQDEDGGSAKKVDVLLHGMETIGSAERSCDPEEMRRQFYSISDGMYAKRLFAEFTKERVEKELDEFLAKPFIKRCGGGIGVTRLIRAMKLSGLVSGSDQSSEAPVGRQVSGQV